MAATRTRRTALRSGSRRHHAAADPQGDRARRAAARDLPRHSGTQRCARWYAGDRDPGARRLARPPRPGQRQSGRTFRHSPERFDQAGQLPCRRVRRGRHHGEFGSSPGRRPARLAGCRSRRLPPTARSRPFRSRTARAFAVGVQWHPEYWVHSDSASAKIFQAFGACRPRPCRHAAGAASSRRIGFKPDRPADLEIGLARPSSVCYPGPRWGNFASGALTVCAAPHRPAGHFSPQAGRRTMAAMKALSMQRWRLASRPLAIGFCNLAIDSATFAIGEILDESVASPRLRGEDAGRQMRGGADLPGRALSCQTVKPSPPLPP